MIEVSDQFYREVGNVLKDFDHANSPKKLLIPLVVAVIMEYATEPICVKGVGIAFEKVTLLRGTPVIVSKALSQNEGYACFTYHRHKFFYRSSMDPDVVETFKTRFIEEHKSRAVKVIPVIERDYASEIITYFEENWYHISLGALFNYSTKEEIAMALRDKIGLKSEIFIANSVLTDKFMLKYFSCEVERRAPKYLYKLIAESKKSTSIKKAV